MSDPALIAYTDRHALLPGSTLEIPTADPIVEFIASTRSWYGGSDIVLRHVRRSVEDVIATQGVFRIRTHMGFLVCR